MVDCDLNQPKNQLKHTINPIKSIFFIKKVWFLYGRFIYLSIFTVQILTKYPMNLLKKTTKVIYLCFIFFGYSSCSSQKQIVLNDQATFQFNEVNFQEWYAGIKVGGTGFNIFLLNITNDENVVLETVYFRNLTGKLVKEKGMYSAILKNNSPYYTWQYPEKPKDYPFDLGADECIISYKENGQTKYLKITSLVEKAGTYYENGPPSIYNSSPNTIIATVDED